MNCSLSWNYLFLFLVLPHGLIFFARFDRSSVEMIS